MERKLTGELCNLFHRVLCRPFLGCGLSLPPSTPSCKRSRKRGNGTVCHPQSKILQEFKLEACGGCCEARLTLPDCTPVRQSSKRASSFHHAVDVQSAAGTCLSEADIDLTVGAEDSPPPSPRIWACKLCSCRFESRHKSPVTWLAGTRNLILLLIGPGVQEPISCVP